MVIEKILENNQYVVLDNVISHALQKEIYDTLDNKIGEFDWYHYDETIPVKSNYDVENTVDTGQFVHIFLMKQDSQVYTSRHLHLVNKIVAEVFDKYKITDQIVTRAKANFLLNNRGTHKNSHSGVHVDLDTPHTVLLYYVNDSDGDTFLFNNDGTVQNRIQPQQGRLLVFDGKVLHASANPINAKKRWVVNIDVEEKTQ